MIRDSTFVIPSEVEESRGVTLKVSLQWLWVAHASRVLVSASRRNSLFREVRDDETSSPARETRALLDPHVIAPCVSVHSLRSL